jgi:hypothetical protein
MLRRIVRFHRSSAIPCAPRANSKLEPAVINRQHHRTLDNRSAND